VGYLKPLSAWVTVLKIFKNSTTFEIVFFSSSLLILSNNRRRARHRSTSCWIINRLSIMGNKHSHNYDLKDFVSNKYVKTQCRFLPIITRLWNLTSICLHSTAIAYSSFVSCSRAGFSQKTICIYKFTKRSGLHEVMVRKICWSMERRWRADQKPAAAAHANYRRRRRYRCRYQFRRAVLTPRDNRCVCLFMRIILYTLTHNCVLYVSEHNINQPVWTSLSSTRTPATTVRYRDQPVETLYKHHTLHMKKYQ